MSAATCTTFLTPHQAMPATDRTQWGTLDERYERCRPALHFIARRILPDQEIAACAVENCWLRASRNPLSFESDGAFGSWIMRLLIREAVCILHQVRTAQGVSENIHGRRFRKHVADPLKTLRLTTTQDSLWRTIE
jgi:DNA-directed RNA polymerase specialized sigma24 family protein